MAHAAADRTPLAAPVDPASFAISKADIALLMRSARNKPGPPPQRNPEKQKCKYDGESGSRGPPIR